MYVPLLSDDSQHLLPGPTSGMATSRAASKKSSFFNSSSTSSGNTSLVPDELTSGNEDENKGEEFDDSDKIPSSTVISASTAATSSQNIRETNPGFNMNEQTANKVMKEIDEIDDESYPDNPQVANDVIEGLSEMNSHQHVHHGDMMDGRVKEAMPSEICDELKQSDDDNTRTFSQ